MLLRGITFIVLAGFTSSGHRVSAKPFASPLSSAPPTTNLSLPLPQNHTSPCYIVSQTRYGDTVDALGRGLYYADENVTSRAANKSATTKVSRTSATTKLAHASAGGAVWGTPTIHFANGSTCCESLDETRAYITYLDSVIVQYLSYRQQFAGEAARFQDSLGGVRAQDLAVADIQQAEGLAVQYGLAAWVANTSYTATINAFTELELCLFDEGTAVNNTISPAAPKHAPNVPAAPNHGAPKDPTAPNRGAPKDPAAPNRTVREIPAPQIPAGPLMPASPSPIPIPF